MKAVDAATLGGLTLLLCLGISIAAPQTARSGIEANAVQAATTLPACCAQHPSGEKEFQADSFAGFFGKMFDTSDYPARWYCGNWTLDVGWLHILSDIGIFVAYLSIASLLIFWSPAVKTSLPQNLLAVCCLYRSLRVRASVGIGLVLVAGVSLCWSG